jgi:EmrB/QacA subfamily drug resistance transporter
MLTPGVTYDSATGRRILVATVLGSSLVMLDATVVNVALPAIGRDLGGGIGGLQWVVDGYLLTLAALILLGGSLGDRYGRRRIFVIGAVWFAVASLLCGLAPSLPLLIATRTLQGVGGALLTPGSLALIEASFVPKDRPMAVGAWSGLGGIATAIGPFVGGWLVQSASWRLIFLLNLPLAVVVALISRRIPESSDPNAARHLDVYGAGLTMVGLAGVTFALIEAPERGATDPIVLVAALTGITALIGFVLVEARSRMPMLPLGIFRSRQFTGANLVTLAIYGALGATFFLLVVFLQQGLGYSPFAAGAATLPTTLIMLLLSARAGALAQRIGPRVPMTVGPLVAGLGIALMARISLDSSYLLDVLPALVVFSLGLSLTVAPLTATVLGAAEDRYAGIASGVNNAVARTAGLIAVAALPAIAGLSGDAFSDPAALQAGFRMAMLLAAGLCVVGGVLAWLTIRNAAPIEAHYACPLGAPPLRTLSSPPRVRPAGGG